MSLTPNHSPKIRENNASCCFDSKVLAGRKIKKWRRYNAILSMFYVNLG